MDWKGQQTFEPDRLGFRWRARIQLGRFLWVDAEDWLDAKGGYGGARLLGIIPAGSAQGPEVTRSQVVRNLAELAFAPMVATRAQDLVWSADGEALKLTAPAVDPEALVRLTIDQNGDVRSARSPDRPREDRRAGFLHEPYRLEFDDHTRVASGARIPLTATGTFETVGGDWTYWRYEVVDAHDDGPGRP
jgi:hypothetical protein